MPNSDRIYSKVLRELYSPAWLRFSMRESYGLIARKLGVDDQTVRSTISRMKRTGFLKGWTIALNPHILEMECGNVLVEGGQKPTAPKDQVISQLQDLDGVVAVFNFLDGAGVRLVFFYEDDGDFERKTRLVSSICGVSSPYASWKIPFPANRVKLKKTDWEIIRSLLRDSRKNVSETAKDVGVSTRTVRRRLDILTQGNSFYPSPVVDAKKVDGFLYHFVVACTNKKDKATLDQLLHTSARELVFVDTNAELYSVVASVCRNIAEADEISDWLRAQPGAGEVTARVFERITLVRGWIEREVDRRLRE